MQICHNTEVQSVETSGSHRLEVSVSQPCFWSNSTLHILDVYLIWPIYFRSSNLYLWSDEL